MLKIGEMINLPYHCVFYHCVFLWGICETDLSIRNVSQGIYDMEKSFKKSSPISLYFAFWNTCKHLYEILRSINSLIQFVFKVFEDSHQFLLSLKFQNYTSTASPDIWQLVWFKTCWFKLVHSVLCGLNSKYNPFLLKTRVRCNVNSTQNLTQF